MNELEIKIANALLDAKDVLLSMMKFGLGDTKYTFSLSNMLIEKYSITREQTIIVIDEALKTI